MLNIWQKLETIQMHLLGFFPSGEQLERRRSCWSSSGPAGHLSFLTRAPPCCPSATTSTESEHTTLKAQFTARGFQLEPCRPDPRIWLLPLPRPPVSPSTVGLGLVLRDRLKRFSLWQGPTRPVWHGEDQVGPTGSSSSTDWCAGSTSRIRLSTRLLSLLSPWR